MTIKIRPNPLPPFKELYQLPKGTWMVVNIGGRGGGKSYEGSKFVTIKAISENKRVVVLRDEKTSIGDSILNEIKNRYIEINEKANNYLDGIYDFNTHELKHKVNGNKLIFTKGFRASSNQKTANLKSISDIDISIIEEFEDITDEQAFNRFTDGIRNKDSLIFINSNIPDMNHWFIKRYFDLEETEHDGYYKLIPKTIQGVVFIISNYTDNPHLPPHIIRKYEGYGDPNSNFYDKHYYLTQIVGLCSSGRAGQIYKNWKRITNEEFNNLPYRSYYGLDFGWSNSPMAFCEIKLHNGKCYSRQLIYEKNLTLIDLAIKLTQLGLSSSDLIMADSAEPHSINKLRNGWQRSELPEGYADKYPQLLNGFYIIPASKGPGSIQAGINRVMEYENYLTDDSTDWWNEYVNYVWAKDKNGNPTDDPLDDFNHLFDAQRYIVMAKGKMY